MIADSDSEETRRGVMYIRLKSYLDELSAIEEAKPEQLRRHVPTMREIADAIGYNHVSMARLSTGKIRSLNLDLGAAIIDEVRRHGFPMRVDDLVAYQGSEDE